MLNLVSFTTYELCFKESDRIKGESANSSKFSATKWSPAFCRLVAFQHSYGRKVFTTINQSKLQKSNIQHGKLFKNIGLVHSEFSIRLFNADFFHS